MDCNLLGGLYVIGLPLCAGFGAAWGCVFPSARDCDRLDGLAVGALWGLVAGLVWLPLLLLAALLLAIAPFVLAGFAIGYPLARGAKALRHRWQTRHLRPRRTAGPSAEADEFD